MKRTLVILAVCFLAAMALQGQVTTATIEGTVTDASGATVANAQVIAVNTGTNQSRTAITNAGGGFRFDLLPSGNYDVEVSAPGFKKFHQNGIVLEINRTARVDPVLAIGALSEEVTITADAVMVNTSNAQIGRTTSGSEINNLPIVGRNVYTLLSLTPGVDSNANSIVLGYPEQRTMINGGVDGGAGSVNYFLDGGTNMTGLRNTGNIAPNPDAVEEFRVITNSYSAEFGRFASGVINIITRSGTNQFHGSLFEFLRNNDLNANNWGSALATPPLHRNQFGGSVGGPVIRNKTFFFGTYSGLRQITSNFFNSAIVPTALERTGDFSQSKVKPTDPLNNGAPFANAFIPMKRFDPTALNILNTYIPLPNTAGNIWQGTSPSPYVTDEFLAKVDHSFSDRQRISLSYFETSGHTSTPGGGNLIWSTQNFIWRQHNANASDTIAISPTLVDQVWLSYTRNFGARLSTPQMSLGDLGSQFKIQGTPSLPQLAVSGYFTLGQAISGPEAGTNFYSIRNVLNWNKGSHTFKLGGEFSLDKDIQQTLLNNYGVFSFTGTKAKSSNALSDFLLGLPITMNQDAPVLALANFFTGGLFAQDDWKVTPRLTFNLGLRWDVQQAPTDPQNKAATFKLGVQSTVLPAGAPTGLLVVGDPGVGRGIVSTPLTHFSPRLGLAWDPFGNGKTSIRAAAGLFYGSVSGNEWNSTSNFQPFAVRQQFPNVTSLTNPYGALPGGVSPFPFFYSPQSPRFIFPASIYGVAPDFRWPYTYQFNFSVERQIRKDLVVTAAYVGSLAHRLPLAIDLNYPIYNSTATAANVNSRRPIDTNILSTIQSVESVMNTNYHGLQITVEKRMGQHFGAKGFYTFSKAIEGATLENSTVAGGVEDFRNIALDRGRSDFDRRHVSVTSFIWDLSYFGGAHPVVKALTNGWQVSSIITLQSGLPFNVTTGTDVNLDGTNNDRPNLQGNPFLDPNRSRAAVTAAWFNTAAFGVPPAGTDGNTQRNLLTGPGSKNVDLAIARIFKIRERVSLQARGEATNAFNLVNLSNPTASFNSPLFGQIRSANQMRQLQVSLRLTF
ncbi:MAG: TonB-dependent receptor [Acidobacteriota bacterium]|nr:TonB-dependent receptor [Acidobacteriota bacterium]